LFISKIFLFLFRLALSHLLLLFFRFSGVWFLSKQDMQSPSSNFVCTALKMTQTTTNGTLSLQETLSYQLFNQSGPAFPVFNQSFIIATTSTPGQLQISGSDVTVSAAVVDVSTSNGLYDYVVLTDGPSFTTIQVLTRFLPSAQQNIRLASFLNANGYYRTVVDVERPADCQYSNGIAPNVLPPSPSEAAAPNNNRVAIIAGSVVGGVAFLSIAVRTCFSSFCAFNVAFVINQCECHAGCDVFQAIIYVKYFRHKELDGRDV
jgi:hypothetical protein